jgi:hypothetical protein
VLVHYSPQTLSLNSIQRVDIWDIVQAFNTSSHAVTQQHNLSLSDARLLTPELVTPDRLLFLDGTLQSLALSERIYHEVMVHPAMFAHPHPEHIVILGGGAEASLREVLKHKTIKSVTMLEIDQELVDIATLHVRTDRSIEPSRFPYAPLISHASSPTNIIMYKVASIFKLLGSCRTRRALF